MQPEDAPPGPWVWTGDRPRLIDGVELESGVPTRFFQSIDAYPAEWGRLIWRVQLNKIVSERAGSPVFRTFYTGVEWNLNRPDYRWFLSAWFHWEGPGPRYRRPCFPVPPLIEGDTALFRFASLPRPMSANTPDAVPEPDLDRPLFLRSRVDARDRRRIAEALRSQREADAKPDPGVIRLDDIIEASE
ncbi:MAG: hypothetical protein ABI186_00540 [Candidatus Elarobacter sp.]